MKLLIAMLIAIIALYSMVSIEILHNTKIIIENHKKEIQKLTLEIEK